MASREVDLNASHLAEIFFAQFKFLFHIRNTMQKQLVNIRWWWHTNSGRGV
jgi:hypothetical protein